MKNKMGKYSSYGIQHDLGNGRSRKRKKPYTLLILIILSLLATVWLIAEYEYDSKKQLFTLTDNVSSVFRSDEKDLLKKPDEKSKIINKQPDIPKTHSKKNTTKVLNKKNTTKVLNNKKTIKELSNKNNVSKTIKNTQKISDDVNIDTKETLIKISLADGISFLASKNGVESKIIIEIENTNIPSATHILDKASFVIDSYDLLPEAINQVDNIAKILTNYQHIDIIISGHTDNIGKEEVNEYFSLQRAKSVRSRLVQQGIKRSRIKVVGQGEKMPILPNTNRINRQTNRRIDITLSR